MNDEWFRAAREGDLETVRALVERGADVNAHDEHGDTALNLAGDRHDSEMAQLLIELGAEWRDTDLNPWTRPPHPLIDAVNRGDAKAVEELLRQGANVNVTDLGRRKGGCTALMRATRNNDVEVMRILIDHGADLTHRNCIEFSALTYAVVQSRTWGEFFGDFEPDPRPLALLLEAGGRLEILEAVLLNDLELARARLDEGADPDTGRDSYYGPVLALAAELGYPEMVKLLLEREADPDATNDLNEIPLALAAGAGRLEIVVTLLDRGASLDPPEPCAGNALQHAAGGGHHAIVRLLLSRGASRTLFDAVALNDEPLAETLLREGADPNDWLLRVGRIPMLAVRRGYGPMLRRLLNHGASHYDRIGDKHPLLTEAAIHGQAHIAQLLIDRGADLHAVGKDGRTALSWAIEKGHDGVVKCLRQAGATC